MSDLVIWVSCAKTADRIEMPFREPSHVGQRNHELDGVKIGQIHSQPRGEKSAMQPFDKLLCGHLLLLLLLA